MPPWRNVFHTGALLALLLVIVGFTEDIDRLIAAGLVYLVCYVWIGLGSEIRKELT